MNMILHDDGHTNIVGSDALCRIERLEISHPKLRPNEFDMVLTNPPFGATIREAEKGASYMEGWQLLDFMSKDPDIADELDETDSPRKKSKKTARPRSIKTEILFCERVWQMLRPGTGRAAIVLPDGLLTNASLQGVRDWMIARFQLLAIVSLPHFAFQHSGAGVKTSVVFVRKRRNTEVVSGNEYVFMAAPENIGYDATGHKTYLITPLEESTSRKSELHQCDLFDMEVVFERARDGNGQIGWQEKLRRIRPNSGLLGEFRRFEKRPKEFLL